MYKVKLQSFEGPFDLLVYLIENAEMSIYDIKISEITTQYLAYIKAMEELAKLQEERGVPEEKRHYASNEMCTFLILNISSLQLIPVNMIAYRTQYGSVNPAIIIAPAMIATAAGLLVSILYCKAKDKLI